MFVAGIGPPGKRSRDTEDVIRYGVSGEFVGPLDNIHVVSTGAAASPCKKPRKWCL